MQSPANQHQSLANEDRSAADWRRVESHPPSPYRYTRPGGKRRDKVTSKPFYESPRKDRRDPISASPAWTGHVELFGWKSYEKASPILSPYSKAGPASKSASGLHQCISDLPSMAGSFDTSYSSFVNSFTSYEDDPYEDRKMAAKPSISAELPQSFVSLPNTGSANNNVTKTIEVSPGQFLRLRDSDETWEAIQTQFYQPCECACCSLSYYCIQDADYSVCPSCKVVSPTLTKQNKHSSGEGGVGLGFRL